MYESYLLNPNAIAAVMNGIAGFRETEIMAEEVQERIVQNRGAVEYQEWVAQVHAAKLLSEMFQELSEARVTYDKVEYGTQLTRWIIQNTPDDLKEISDLLMQVMERKEPKS
jgi:hypothetical protein